MSKETMDEQWALAEMRKALVAEIARRRAAGEWDELAGAPPEDRAGPPDPALCPRPLCRRYGKCRPPGTGPCLNDPAERMRNAICERLRALRRAGGAV